MIEKTSKRRGRGRPPKTTTADKKLTIRISSEQDVLYKKAAKNQGKTVSGWLKETADTAAIKILE